MLFLLGIAFILVPVAARTPTPFRLDAPAGKKGSTCVVFIHLWGGSETQAGYGYLKTGAQFQSFSWQCSFAICCQSIHSCSWDLFFV
ncbi:hypothetical protein B0T19DRAFT_291231 [Cercophora scortea]|uniref:Uncharacterized protein n=1 Tax=Cercophora scortea TaxID=314031 RepID=A0AAE0I2N0_9PEZI|nr:hypothetical protein B0T19DRAFT_291231 [Cercophora scortea]